MSPKPQTVYREPSWGLCTDQVEAWVTRAGGHLGPVTFCRDAQGQGIQPYHIAPWNTKPGRRPAGFPPILRVLRGDFFCCPFGGNDQPYQGRRYPIHGHTANDNWRCLSREAGDETQRLHLRWRRAPEQVDKYLTLRRGENVVYSQHVLSGFTGPMNPGHHATLQFPDRPGSGRLSVSPFVLGSTYPTQLEDPTTGGYCSIKANQRFSDLRQVPLINGELADLTYYPARRGYEDIVLVMNDPKLPLGWVAVTFPEEGFVWFTLKDPQVLSGTLMWLSNGGRHYAPWSGRHVNVMGLEDLTSFFAYGLAEAAAPNFLSDLGLRTCHHLRPDQPLTINYIQGVARVPKGFGRVARMTPIGNDRLRLVADNGLSAEVPVNLAFLHALPGAC